MPHKVKVYFKAEVWHNCKIYLNRNGIDALEAEMRRVHESVESVDRIDPLINSPHISSSGHTTHQYPIQSNNLLNQHPISSQLGKATNIEYSTHLVDSVCVIHIPKVGIVIVTLAVVTVGL